MAVGDYFYTDGTITVTNGSTAITGVDTAWELRHATGAIVFVGQDFGFIASVEDDGSATLTKPWEGATAAAADYTMWLVPSEAAENLANNQRLSELIVSLDAAQPESPILSAIDALDFVPDSLIVATSPTTFRVADKSEFTQGVDYDAFAETITQRATYDLQAAGYSVLVANAPGENLLSNPGFEAGTVNWGFITGITLDTTVPRTGVNCAKLDKGVVGAGGTARGLISGAPIPVTGGDAYTLSAWMRGSGVSTGGAYVQVVWKDFANATISTVSFVANAAFNATYANYSASQSAPANAATATVVISILTTATAQSLFVDDISFTKNLSGRSAIYTKKTATSADWSVPAYLTGPAGGLSQIAIGTTTTLNPADPATVVNAGTPTAPVLNFGIPKGRSTNWLDLYNPATAYVVDDTVFYNGSSWRNILATTGNAPPAAGSTPNTWWTPIAIKGTGDVNGPAGATAGNLAMLDVTGKIIADSGLQASVFATLRNVARRNRMVNPSCNISQENGFGAANTQNFYTCDQFYSIWNSSTGTFATQLMSNIPSLSNSNNRMRFSIGTPDTSLASTEYYILRTRIEGYRIQDFGWGTANSKAVILSFECAGPVGTYTVAVRNGAGTHCFLGTFTIAVASVQARYTILIPPFTTASTWDVTNGIGAEISFVMAGGSGFAGVAGWQAGNLLVAPGQTNGIGASGSFYFTDFDLYINTDGATVARPYETSDYSEDLIDCMRYWQQTTAYWSGACVTGNTFYLTYDYTVRPRSTPTLSGTSLLATGFPATTGSLTNIDSGCVEGRVSNATVGTGLYRSLITANARL